MTALREGLPALPERFLKLPIDARGYPIPWFVITMPDGTRDFRIADQHKRRLAVRDRLCWLCGERLGRYAAFVISPMCVVNRNTSEPGCHLECAEFAARACPFLTLPKAKYREANLPAGSTQLAGSIGGNPGACAIYVCTSFQTYVVPGTRDWLIRLGDPTHVSWWTGGRVATRQEILDVLAARLPLLEEIAQQEGPEAIAHLGREVETAKALLPVA